MQNSPYGDEVVLKPLQIRKEFYAELDVIEKDFEKHGGKSLAKMRTKYKIG